MPSPTKLACGSPAETGDPAPARTGLDAACALPTAGRSFSVSLLEESPKTRPGGQGEVGSGPSLTATFVGRSRFRAEILHLLETRRLTSLICDTEGLTGVFLPLAASILLLPTPWHGRHRWAPEPSSSGINGYTCFGLIRELPVYTELTFPAADSPEKAQLFWGTNVAA